MLAMQAFYTNGTGSYVKAAASMFQINDSGGTTMYTRIFDDLDYTEAMGAYQPGSANADFLAAFYGYFILTGSQTFADVIVRLTSDMDVLEAKFLSPPTAGFSRSSNPEHYVLAEVNSKIRLYALHNHASKLEVSHHCCVTF